MFSRKCLCGLRATIKVHLFVGTLGRLYCVSDSIVVFFISYCLFYYNAYLLFS